MLYIRVNLEDIFHFLSDPLLRTADVHVTSCVSYWDTVFYGEGCMLGVGKGNPPLALTHSNTHTNTLYYQLQNQPSVPHSHKPTCTVT